MNILSILALLQALLPTLEEGVGAFIHNPKSQGNYGLIIGDINTVAAIGAIAAQKTAPAAPSIHVDLPIRGTQLS